MNDDLKIRHEDLLALTLPDGEGGANMPVLPVLSFSQREAIVRRLNRMIEERLAQLPEVFGRMAPNASVVNLWNHAKLVSDTHSARLVGSARLPCAICHGEGWVCEDHRDTAWGGGDACCGGAGAPCKCSPDFKPKEKI